VQTQDTIRTLSQESTDNNNDINCATGLIQDADNSKLVNSHLWLCACSNKHIVLIDLRVFMVLKMRIVVFVL
jgi:hypothetical protein